MILRALGFYKGEAVTMPKAVPEPNAIPWIMALGRLARDVALVADQPLTILTSDSVELMPQAYGAGSTSPEPRGERYGITRFLGRSHFLLKWEG